MSILGLTATATTKVIEDVKQILKIPRCILFRAPFNRKNLFYEVLHKSDVGKDAFHELVHCIHHRFANQSGIVYCLSQRDAEDVCAELQRNGKKKSRDKDAMIRLIFKVLELAVTMLDYLPYRVRMCMKNGSRIQFM